MRMVNQRVKHVSRRKKFVLEDLLKQLRFLQFTIVISCLVFLVVALSDRSEGIQLANKQIKQIFHYTSHWEVNHAALVGESAPKSNVSYEETIHFSPGSSNYALCTETPCKYPKLFGFNFQPYRLGATTDSVANVFNLNPISTKPHTLQQFENFYDDISHGCCFYRIVGFQPGSIQHFEGYIVKDPTGDPSSSKSSFAVQNVGIMPISDEEVANYEKANADRLLELQTIDGVQRDPDDVPEYSAEILDTLKSIEFVEYSEAENVDLDGASLVISSHYNKLDYESHDVYAFPPFEIERKSFDGVALLKRDQWTNRFYRQQFKALYNVTKDWPEISIATAKEIIDAEANRGGGRFQDCRRWSCR